MTIDNLLGREAARYGADAANALLRHLPEIVAWLRHRRFDPAAVTADFERLTRDAKAEYDAGHARLLEEAERERQRDEPTATHRISDSGEAT